MSDDVMQIDREEENEFAEKLRAAGPLNLAVEHNIFLPGMEATYVKILVDEIPQGPPQIIPKLFRSIRCGREDFKEGRKIWDLSFLNSSLFPVRKVEPPNDLFATCGGPFIHVYRLSRPLADTFETLHIYVNTIQDDDLYTLSWGLLNDGEPILACAGKQGIILLINVYTYSLVGHHLVGHKNAIHQLKFAPGNSAFLLSASEDLSIRLWNILTFTQVAIFAGDLGHKHGVLTIDWHSTENIFASGGRDGAVKIWKITDELKNAMDESMTWNQNFMNNGANIPCARTPFRTKMIFEPEFSTNRVHKSYVDCVKFYGNLIYSKGQEGCIVVWKPHPERNPDSVTVLFTLNFPRNSEIGLRFTIDYEQDLLVLGGTESNCYLFDLTWESTEFREIKNALHTFRSPVRSAGFTADSSKMVYITDDCFVHLLQKI
ncbi:unnamed protein product [Blepharisma stoltei]|uniref:Uncharacterized protein n=1 Tax=Blepharisma stoltei TaxID=1481888 RepID=A0AAU9JNH1_9CILI|nr:unnamed protein product [Blepharisma stoltei]